MPDKSPSPDDRLQTEFNRWANEGEGPKMEQHHLDITEKTIRLMELRPGERVLDRSGWRREREEGRHERDDHEQGVAHQRLAAPGSREEGERSARAAGGLGDAGGDGAGLASGGSFPLFRFSSMEK